MESMRQGYGPLLGSVSHVDHQSPEALEAEIERVAAAAVAAFFCEPVIGAGGVRPAPPGYIEAVAAICKRHGVLLVIDSVICAFGRVGTWFGYERWDIEPDMVVLAKGITSGYLPLGGVLISAAVAEPFWSSPGGAMFRHGATYAGHPTCCAAALENLAILERENLIPRGRELEGELMDVLAPLLDHPACGEIRGGLGLAAAVDLAPELLENVPGAMLRYGSAIREAGVLLRPQATGVAIGPPLTVERSHLDEIATAVRAGLDAVAAAARRAASIVRARPPSPAGARHGRHAAHDAPPQAARADRARQPQGRHAGVGAVQPRHPGPARAARDRHDRRKSPRSSVYPCTASSAARSAATSRSARRSRRVASTP